MHRDKTFRLISALAMLSMAGVSLTPVSEEDDIEWQAKQAERKANEAKINLEREHTRKFGCTENRMPHQGKKEMARRLKKLI
jgi:hypothetical protein